MDFEDEESGYGFRPPSQVFLTPFASSVSPSPRRLSSCFRRPSEPVRSKRQLAWVSLQGRLVGAEEATSAKTIDRNGVLSPEAAAAWELFTPIQRVLTVGVVAAAAHNSNKNKEILKLQKSVDLRDQVLSSMQKKLDILCEQMNHFKDQPEVETLITVECESNLPPNGSLTSTKGLDGDEVFKYKLPVLNETEPDVRRMSDLSDWAPSVTSSVDIQFDSLALGHDIDALRKECEQKDLTIMELSTLLNSSDVLGSKRIEELEDIIRRKNMIINKLRKDIIILEQKVVNLTRLRRSSFPAATSYLKHFPTMADNLVYDMDSTTDPSASDSDSSSQNPRQTLSREKAVQINERASTGDLQLTEKNVSPRTRIPLQEKSCNQASNSVPASKLKHATYSGGENRSRRRPPLKSKDLASNKRWV
ncbi:hypothetical protein ACS0TY_005408 [Phlomoides rotata]